MRSLLCATELCLACWSAVAIPALSQLVCMPETHVRAEHPSCLFGSQTMTKQGCSFHPNSLLTFCINKGSNKAKHHRTTVTGQLQAVDT